MTFNVAGKDAEIPPPLFTHPRGKTLHFSFARGLSGRCRGGDLFAMRLKGPLFAIRDLGAPLDGAQPT